MCYKKIMPYLLSAPIHTELPGLWGEGPPYQTELIYDIHSTQSTTPPVHYQAHTIKPHSIPHIDAPGHITPDGLTVDKCVQGDRQRCFYGPAVVVKLRNRAWIKLGEDSNLWLWRVGQQELQSEIARVTGSTGVPSKLLLSAQDAPLTADGFHDSNHILVLSEDAARWLISSSNFSAYGTSWKSSDFQPGSRERPIHKILFERAILFEHLKLDHVPEGRYFFSAFPLILQGATESPVTAALFTRDEVEAWAD